jgi:methionine-rich copper-binding protein CopC
MPRLSLANPPALRRGAILAALAAASCVAAAGAATALGHTGAVSSAPRSGSVLAHTPARVTIVFAGPVARVGTVRATRNGKENLVKRKFVSPRNASVVELKRPGPRKQAGAYRVVWRVTGPDGHPVSGVVGFRVRG